MLLLLSLLLFCSAFQAALGVDYTIVVETSGSNFAGTDANVYIRVTGTTNNIAEKRISGAFERNDVDTDTISSNNPIGALTKLEIRRGDSGFGPDWKLDKITFKNPGYADSVFNYNDWVGESFTTLTLSCEFGYSVNSQGYCDVTDVNECLNPSSCISPATCVNTVGSYYCNCPSGYAFKTGSQKECEDINECTNQGICISPATCVNTPGSYECDCPSGYVLKSGTNNECQDIDECDNNVCDSVKSTCENLPGTYQCNCKSGYQNLDPKQCINADECDLGTDSCNKTSSYCRDSEGSYYCLCKDGFTQGANNKICVAISCVPLSPPSGSTLEPARCTQPNANIFGDKCAMNCTEGYVISDIQLGILTCGSKGTWEGNMGTCNPVACSALPAISNGQIHPMTCSSSGGKYTEMCTYSCDNGYTLLGQGSRQCKADGTWGGAAPTCSQIVVQPWISCPGSIIQDLASGKSTADVSSVWKEPTSNVQQITINPPEISSSYQFPAGTTMVEWTASNSAGSASCSINVIIRDKEPPTVQNCPQDIFQTSDTATAAVTWPEPTFSDNIGVTNVEKSHTSGDTFDLGSTNVNYEAMDQAANRISCQFTVSLQRPSCYPPDGPLGGSKTKVSDTLYQLTCPSGSQLYKWTLAYLYIFCQSGAWTPDTIPDCVVSTKKDPSTPCEQGRIEMTVVTLNELHCTKCPLGTHKSSATDCSQCPAGTYNDQQGQVQCTQTCPAGTSSLPGAKAAEDCKQPCPAGRYSANGLGPSCQDCAHDTYQDKTMQDSCIACPSGTFTVAKGSSSPDQCGVTPKVTIDPLVSNIKEKESVSVNCYASGMPTPTYKWNFLRVINENFLGVMSQVSLTNANGDVIGSKLVITGATYENSGSYECVATNTHGSDMGLANIQVEKVIGDVGGSGDQQG